MTEAVILVPGIMGSVLKDNDNVIWPGSVAEMLFPYRHMDELLKPDLQATDVIRSVSISNQYGDLIYSLNQCGFHEDSDAPTLKVFPYDWRKDNAEAAHLLADCVDAMASDSGDNVEITLLAHSMGGLVSRYYLESGKYSSRPGFSCIRRLITLGTPHYGAPIALTAALGQEKRLFLSAAQVQRIANDKRFPSLYQLLPPKGEPFVWNRDAGARIEPVDIYDEVIAKKIGLVLENVAAAAEFHQNLSFVRRPDHVRYFFFAGTRQETAHAVEVTFLANRLARVVKLIREGAGDGTVPIWSSSSTAIQMAPVSGEHGEIYKCAGLKRLLGSLLGKPGVLLAAGVTPEISVLNKVVEPSTSTKVIIDFPARTQSANGKLELRRKIDPSGRVQANPPVFFEKPISYSGPTIDHLTLELIAPEYPGIYELSLVLDPETVITAELFVQAANFEA